MKRIFLSHSSKDKEFTLRLASDLREAGHLPWIDAWEIKVGDSIPGGIESGLHQADFVVVILSRHSVNSEWVDREWKTKYWQEVKDRRIAVLPVLIEDCEIPALLTPKKYADFRQTYTLGLTELLRGIDSTSPILRALRDPQTEESAPPAKKIPPEMLDSVQELFDDICERAVEECSRSLSPIRVASRCAAIFVLHPQLRKFQRIASYAVGNMDTYLSKPPALFQPREFFGVYNEFCSKRSATGKAPSLGTFRQKTAGFVSPEGLAFEIERKLVFYDASIFSRACRSLVALPISVNDRMVGVLALAADYRNSFFSQAPYYAGFSRRTSQMIHVAEAVDWFVGRGIPDLVAKARPMGQVDSGLILRLNKVTPDFREAVGI